MDNGACSYRRFRDEGDENGLAEIIKDYRDGLIFYLNGFVNNIHIAEELAEDTFVLLGTKKTKRQRFRFVQNLALHNRAEYSIKLSQAKSM